MVAKKIIATEHQEQKCLIEWWDIYARSKGLDARLLFSIPNCGAGASKGQAGKMKAEGVRAGAPDLFLAIKGKIYAAYNGLFLELKRTDWKEPGSGAKAEHWRNQCSFHQMLQNQGYRVRVCAGADAAMAAIKEYLA